VPVNSTHPDYDANAFGWLRARDVLAGEDAVKSAGEKYLPRLDSQSGEEFLAYRKRASFFNATARSAEGFVGLIFRRPPFIKIPEGPTRTGVLPARGNDSERRAGDSTPHLSGIGKALAEFVHDADMQGTTLSGYAKNVVTEVVGIGRAGSLVDWCSSPASHHAGLPAENRSGSYPHGAMGQKNLTEGNEENEDADKHNTRKGLEGQTGAEALKR